MSFPDENLSNESYAKGNAQWHNPAAAHTFAGYPPARTALRTPPSPNGGWAAVAFVFFWPLAFVAFSKALSVPMLWMQGRYDEAYAASESVERLGKTALVVGIALSVLFCALYFVFIAAAIRSANELPHYSYVR